MANLILKNNTANGKTYITADRFLGSANSLYNQDRLENLSDIDNFLSSNQCKYAIFSTNEISSIGFGANDGLLLSFGWSNTEYGAQMAFDDNSVVGNIAFRGKSGNTWSGWYKLLHSGNYNSYSPSLTGSGASGNWDINSASATKFQTARTLTIGSKGKSFDGTENVSWTLAEIGAKPAEPTYFSMESQYVAVRTPVRTASQYYEFWDSGVGWAGIRAGDIYEHGYRIYSPNNKPTPGAIGAVAGLGVVSNTATVYDASIASIAGGSGSPSGAGYGEFITLPYRQCSGNAKPDYGGQIFLPNGDDPITPDGLFYRTGVKDAWRGWKSVIHSCARQYFGGTLPSSGMSTGDIFFKT